MAKKYITYLNGLRSKELVVQRIEDRFRGVMEIRRAIEKETTRVNALIGLDWVAKGVGKFEEEWDELVKAGLPSCWAYATAAFSSLTNYEEKLEAVMNQTNLSYEKNTHMKAETIIATLGKEISLLF